MSEMKVWIIYIDYGHEGYSEPKKIFNTLEKAKAYVAAETSLYIRNRYEIEEMNVE